MISDKIVGLTINSFFIKSNTDFVVPKGMSYLDEIVLVFNNNEVLKLLPDYDTDEIICDLSQNAKANLSTYDSLSQYEGLMLSDFWMGENSRGYSDIFLLSFKNLHPNLLIISEGSCLKLFTIAPASPSL